MFTYDFALSFAGEDRAIAEEVAGHLKRHGVRVFYDMDFAPDLLGKDLADHFARLYRDEARYCVVFLSTAYLEKLWCRWERRAAIARAFQSAAEYVLPYRLEPVDLASIPDTIGRADFAATPPKQFADVLLRKLFRAQSALEIHPGVYVALTEGVALIQEGQSFHFETDDVGYSAAVHLPITIRNTTDAEIRVTGDIDWPRGGRHHFNETVLPASVVKSRLPVAEATQSGDGDIEVFGPSDLGPEVLRREERAATAHMYLEELLAVAFKHVSMAEYPIRFRSPSDAEAVLIVDSGRYRIRS